MYLKKLATGTTVISMIMLGALFVPGGSAFASYGGGGNADVYQVALSFNCNNPSFCGSTQLGGFWGWGEFDHNLTTGAYTGDAQVTGCGHSGTFSGADHTSIQITKWWIDSGSAGPATFFTNEVDTTTYRGVPTVTLLNNSDTGIPAKPGHYSTSQIFGFTPPPGVSAQIQVAFKPAH